MNDSVENRCIYCGKTFKKAQTLFVHVCEKKRRANAKNEKHVVIAFDAFNRFYKINHAATQDKTYDDFMQSPFYNAFVKFGSFVNNVNPLYPHNFIDYVVKSGVKLDHWCRDDLYDNYVVNLIRTENVETALERSINHMIDWGKTTGMEWDQYFVSVSLNRFVYDIKDGKISPWLVLQTSSGKNMLKQMSDEQLEKITVVIDPSFWMIKFKRQPSDVELVKMVVNESKL